jgi:hypothetical protein
MPAAPGYSKVSVQVTFIAALDDNGNVLETWWSFAPDQVELKYTGPGNPPDEVLWKLSAYKVDGSKLKGVALARQDGIKVKWNYAQPVRRNDQTYELDAQNLNSSNAPDGPYDFIATVEYGGAQYPSPDPEIVFEPAGN